MAVEIKELVIRAVVREGGDGEAQAPQRERSAAVDREALVQEAVREVLRVLKASKER